MSRERAAALRRVRDVTGRVLQAGQVVATSDQSVHRLAPVAVSRSEGEALRDWVVRVRAQESIEIGLGYGVSALFICDGLLSSDAAEIRHVVIDPNQASRFANCGLQLIDEAGLSAIVEAHLEASQLVLPRLVAEGRRVDLAFVDGNHRFDALFVDLFYLARVVRPGGVVFVDDYQLPGVARAISFWVTNLGWSMEEVSTAEPEHHWSVLRTATGPDTRRFDHFVDF